VVLRTAQELAGHSTKNLLALGQPKAAGGQVQLLVRPQEAVASVQALARAYADYYGAVADYDRAQFRLYRALGNPGEALVRGGVLGAPMPLDGCAAAARPSPQPALIPAQPDR
jgi:hypothetical protein